MDVGNELGLSEPQVAVVNAIVSNPANLHGIWSIAGTGKSLTFKALLCLWREHVVTSGDSAMVWIMLPRQHLREEMFEKVKRAFGDDELMIWGSHGEWEDYLDDWMRGYCGRTLMSDSAELEKYMSAIASLF